MIVRLIKCFEERTKDMSREMYDRGYEIGRKLDDMCNIMSHRDGVEGLKDAIKATHRYVQGEEFAVLLEIIEMFAEYKEHEYDERNRYAVMTARKIMEALA